MTPDELAERLRDEPAMDGLQLLVLHGSRARGDHRPESDWDLGVLSQGPVDPVALSDVLASVLRTDALDLVELDRASALLRYRAARDGVPLLERPRGEFERFQLVAVQYWCDVGTVIRAAQNDVLASLG